MHSLFASYVQSLCALGQVDAFAQSSCGLVASTVRAARGVRPFAYSSVAHAPSQPGYCMRGSGTRCLSLV
eukprot:COSAG02_NODE_215_length_28614_cov_43.077047_5_plen_70_part_00